MTNPSNTARIRELNDLLRQTLHPMHGRVVITAGIDALPDTTKQQIIERVKAFDAFTPDNDPHQEHDFGDLEVDGYKVFWKLDYYDSALEYGSEDPANEHLTIRVLTIMLAEEY